MLIKQPHKMVRESCAFLSMANFISLPNFPASHITPPHWQQMPPLPPALRRVQPKLIGNKLTCFRQKHFGLPNAVDCWISASFCPKLPALVLQGVGTSVAGAVPWDSNIFLPDFVECWIWKTKTEVSTLFYGAVRILTNQMLGFCCVYPINMLPALPLYTPKAGNVD
jgi:hypothetical protein